MCRTRRHSRVFAKFFQVATARRQTARRQFADRQRQTEPQTDGLAGTIIYRADGSEAVWCARPHVVEAEADAGGPVHGCCAATSISSAPAAAPPSRIAELEALVSWLRAETVQLAEAVTRAEERAELERGFETEESDSGVEPPRQPIRLPWRLHSASSC